MRFIEGDAQLSEPVDVEPHPSGLVVAQAHEPVTHLWLELDLTPYSTHAILAAGNDSDRSLPTLDDCVMH